MARFTIPQWLLWWEDVWHFYERGCFDTMGRNRDCGRSGQKLLILDMVFDVLFCEEWLCEGS